MRHVSHVSMLSIRNVFLATTLLGSMALAVSAAPPGNPPANNPVTAKKVLTAASRAAKKAADAWLMSAAKAWFG